MKQQHADAVEVALRRGRRASEDFGSEIERRAREVSLSVGHRKVEPGAEVGDEHATIAIAQHVLRLQIAVKQPGAMNRLERPAQVDADPDDLGARQRPAFL